MADPYFAHLALQLVAAWPGKSASFDSSGDFKRVSINGGVSFMATPHSPVTGSSSFCFDGEYGTSIASPDSNDFKFGHGDFTIDLWLYLFSTPGPEGCLLFGRGQHGSNNGDYIVWIGSDSRCKLWLAGSAPQTVVTFDTAVPLLSWVHIEIDRHGDVVLGFLNGISDANGTSTSGTEFLGAGDFTVGADQIGKQRLHGLIDGLRVLKGVSRHTSSAGFTPPMADDYSYASMPNVSRVVFPHFHSPQNTASQLPGSPPSVTASVQALRRDIYFGGAGRVAGVTTVNGVAASKRVWLQEKASKLVIAQTWSAANGTYEFNNVDPEREYVVFSDDHTKVYNAVVSDRVVPA